MDKSIRFHDRTYDLPQVAKVDALRPLRWLMAGWDDFRHNPGPSIAHGSLLVGVGWLMLLFLSAQIDLLAVAVSGYLLVGPIFGAVFYELSRLRDAGQPASFDASLKGALNSGKRLMPLGSVLAILAILWAMSSNFLFERGFGGVPPSIRDNFYRTIVDWDYPVFFATYLAVGAIFALMAFFLSAVSAPMIFEREVGTDEAILTSIKAVDTNPAAMVVWAALIVVLTAVGFATFLFGLAVVLPLLGHATWHAYRDLITWKPRAQGRTG
ncbi:MAG: DUF2189 domain-containing protein [Burkholderiales bacterium]|nr:DUF2189 domain-containing protein [Burkholderiales bacterium]